MACNDFTSDGIGCASSPMPVWKRDWWIHSCCWSKGGLESSLHVACLHSPIQRCRLLWLYHMDRIFCLICRSVPCLLYQGCSLDDQQHCLLHVLCIVIGLILERPCLSRMSDPFLRHCLFPSIHLIFYCRRAFICDRNVWYDRNEHSQWRNNNYFLL